MKRKLIYIRLWLKRHTHMPLFLIAGIVIVMLYVNDDTSLKRNKAYDDQIRELNAAIQVNKDSAAYYRQKYESLLTEREDMERVAREQYNMQRSIEDVYIIEE